MLPKNVHYLSTQRHLTGGASTGAYANFNLASYVADEQEAVAHNRQLLKQHFNLPAEPKWLNQTHSNICVEGTSSDCNGDAVITQEKNTVCAVLTADCLPIFASSASGTQVGLAHAGWQGIVNGVIESFVESFNESDLQVHFGPAISKKAFEVGKDVYQQFMQKEVGFATAFSQSTSNANKYQLDIYQAARFVLNNLGVKSITGGQECTFTQSKKYFSYRRDGAQSGRMAHLIWMK